MPDISLKRVDSSPGEPRLNVIFVHGLGGDPVTTWCHKGGENDGYFWLKDIAKEIEGIAVYTLGYPGDKAAWNVGWPIAEAAEAVLAKLMSSRELRASKSAPIAFICHSLGGTIIKKLVVTAYLNRGLQPLKGEFLDRIAGVVFLATPHDGSIVASIAKTAYWFVSKSLGDLEASDAELLELGHFYRDRIANEEVVIRHRVYYEKLGMWGQKVVTAASADPGLPGVSPIPVDRDHMNICKLESKVDPVYEGVIAFLQDEVLQPRKPTAQDGNIAEFLFATDRGRTPSNDAESFGFERSPALTFGAARVNVPDDDHHDIGQLELPSKYTLFGVTLYKEKLDPRKHFFIIDPIKVIDREKFIQIVRAIESRAALVFVHGFNTTFNEAVLRFAQILWDMQFKGVPILYSWPSRGGALNYLYDKESTLSSRPRFIELLQLLQSHAEIENIHILAHSMGNMIVLDALHQATQQFVARPLAEIMLAAPDVPLRAFSDWIAGLGKIAGGITLYASSQDRALLASRKANAGSRAGDVMADGPMVFPGVDSIDVSAIGAELFGLNHNVFASNRSLIDDIGRIVLTGQRPVNERSPQIRGMPKNAIPPRYWRYPK